MKLPEGADGLVERSKKRLNLAVLLLFANFLKNGLITFLYILYTASWDDIDQLSRDGFHWIIQKVIFKVGKVIFSPFPIIIDIIQ